MKKLVTLLSVLSAVATAVAGTYSYSPTPSDLYDLEHSKAYEWSIDAGAALKTELASGLVITSATLTITNIYDWIDENGDCLFIDLLNNPDLVQTTTTESTFDSRGRKKTKKVTEWVTGVKTYSDNAAGAADYFASVSDKINLAAWSDPAGGKPTGFNLVINLTAEQIKVLTAYLTDAKSSNEADFGFGFDPDCHYYNGGISFVIQTGTATVADGGTTLILLGLGLSALAGVRRFFRA